MNRQEFIDKVQQVFTRAADAEHLPDTAPIVAMFAENYMPINPPEASADNMTSYEIVELLEDTCRLSVNEVAVVMTFLGFRLFVNENRGYEWAMTGDIDSF